MNVFWLCRAGAGPLPGAGDGSLVVSLLAPANSTNVRLARQKSELFQWLAELLWFLTGKDGVPADSGDARFTILRSRNRWLRTCLERQKRYPAGANNWTNFRLTRQKSELFQWLASQLRFAAEKDSLATDSGWLPRQIAFAKRAFA
jgi:hypothetical protein